MSQNTHKKEQKRYDNRFRGVPTYLAVCTLYKQSSTLHLTQSTTICVYLQCSVMRADIGQVYSVYKKISNDVPLHWLYITTTSPKTNHPNKVYTVLCAWLYGDQQQRNQNTKEIIFKTNTHRLNAEMYGDENTTIHVHCTDTTQHNTTHHSRVVATAASASLG